MNKQSIVIDKDEMLLEEIINGLINDTFEDIINSHFASGNPIYSGSDEYPDKAIKTYPDGRQEVVYFNKDGHEIVEKVIA